MKKDPVVRRISAALMALVLTVSCVLTVCAADAFTGDSSTGKVIVEIISGGGGTINFEINGEIGTTSGQHMSKNVPVGAPCSATADNTGEMPFLYWIDGFSGRIVSYDPELSFVAASRVSYTAVFNTSTASQRVVQYVNYGGNTLMSKFIFEKGATITPPASPATAGFVFRGWSKSTSEVNNSDEDMIVTAQFDVKDETYTVAITNEDYASGAGTYSNYQTVHLKAEAKNGSGQTFSYWKNSDGEIVSYERNYSFRINYDTTLTAVYGEDVTPEPIIRTSRIYRDPDNYQMTFFAERSVPENYTVVSHGILLSASATVRDTQMRLASGSATPTATVRKVYGNSTENCGTFSLAKSLLTDSTTVTARPFLICQDATGKQYLTYGDIIKATNADPVSE